MPIKNALKLFNEARENFFKFAYKKIVIILLIILFLALFGLFIYVRNNKKYILFIEQQFLQINEKLSVVRSDSFQQTITAVDPIQRNIERVRLKVEDLEKRGINEENSIKNLLLMQRDLQKATESIQKEAFRFITLFTKPNIRGGWSEEHLKKIIEMTGMLPYCDFSIQETMGNKRPDLVIKLPNEGRLFIDSKAPLDAYLSAPANLNEHDFEILRKNNLKAIKNHIYLLSNKKYWSNEISPEMVVMFLPIERIWLDALEEDPKLLEYATSKNVIVSTPMTLIALLKTIWYGWSQVYIAKDAEKLKESISDLSCQTKELCDKLSAYINSTVENQEKLKKSIQNMQELNRKIKIVCSPGPLEQK